MTASTRDPFHEDPAPPFVEVDEVDLEVAWEGEGDDRVVCPECDSGHYSARGTSTERRWVSFSPCGHVIVLGDWAVA